MRLMTAGKCAHALEEQRAQVLLDALLQHLRVWREPINVAQVLQPPVHLPPPPPPRCTVTLRPRPAPRPAPRLLGGARTARLSGVAVATRAPPPSSHPRSQASSGTPGGGGGGGGGFGGSKRSGWRRRHDATCLGGGTSDLSDSLVSPQGWRQPCGRAGTRAAGPAACRWASHHHRRAPRLGSAAREVLARPHVAVGDHLRPAPGPQSPQAASPIGSPKLDACPQVRTGFGWGRTSTWR